jgi:hypothetical protein
MAHQRQIASDVTPPTAVSLTTSARPRAPMDGGLFYMEVDESLLDE